MSLIPDSADQYSLKEWQTEKNRERKTDRIQLAIDRYPDPVYREIMRMHLLNKMSLRKVAQKLNLKRESTRKKYHKILNYVKNLMESIEE